MRKLICLFLKLIGLFFMVFLLCMTVINVRSGDAFSAAMCSAGTMCWLGILMDMLMEGV